jgi:hypothetical protein
MKHLTILLICTLLLVGCKKEKYGNVHQQIRATSSQLSEKVTPLKGAQELKYSQFGDFITSLTPSGFVGDLYAARFVTDSIVSNDVNMMTLAIADLQNGIDPLSADFSNNATIPVIPVLNGVNTIVTNEDGQGTFFKEDVTFKMLWLGMELKLTVTLPEAYTDVSLNQFQGISDHSEKQGNVLTTSLGPLNQILGIPALNSNGLTIYFGMTDNTFFSDGSMMGNAPGVFIRSANYTEWTMIPPLPEETKTYVSTIWFVNDNIIHIYAGADNIPYTEDDIIVLEPEFWERIYINVSEI